MPHLFPMPKVYSYTRFSTPEQAEGDSERRQVAAASKFAAERDLELDDTLKIKDAGVSAYRGANLSADAGLGRFLEAVREGLVEPGSILLLESLDRFSRAEPLKVQHELTGLLLAGVNVATLTDGKIYSRESLAQDNGLGLMVALMVAIRAHEESATKGRRVAAAWAEKRRKIRAGEPGRLTRRAPAWLSPEGDGWKIVEERAAVVRRVYALTLAGVGEHRIAETLNREGVKPFGRGGLWHRSAIAKLLSNPAVIGELVPGHIEHVEGRKRRVLEEPIAGAFPSIIDEETWLAVRALKDGATSSARGVAGSRQVASILAGLARCPLCASAMTRVMKGSAKKAGVPKLVCTRAKLGAGCEYHSVPLELVEAAILGRADAFARDIPAGNAGKDLDREALSLESSIAGTVAHLTDLTEALQAHPSRAGAERVARLERELETLEEAAAALEERRRLTDHGLVASRVSRLVAAIEGFDGLDKGPINGALRSVLTGIVVDFVNKRLRFVWKQGGETGLGYAWQGHGEPPAPQDT